VVLVTEFPPATAPAAALAEYAQVEVEAGQADQPAGDRPALKASLARLTRPSSPGRRRLHWTGRLSPGGPVAGVASLMLAGDQYTDLAIASVTVHPDHRRRGLGTALLRVLAAAAAGRQCLFAEGLRDGSAGQAWADALGFAVVQRTLQLALDLRTADRDRWQVPAPSGYRLAEWTGRTPGELLASYAAARNTILEAPHGTMSFSEPEWTPDRIRDDEAAARAQRCELQVAAAIHEPSGEVAGLTYLEIHPSRPQVAVQQDTAVVPGHRGHQLGAWVKAANLRRLTRDHPGVATINTSNAAENEHMLRVNERLGFVVTARTENREASVADLIARPGR
jgi:mycothiol synthase